jgi:RNA polymerase sigma factor (sigma-70 family)
VTGHKREDIVVVMTREESRLRHFIRRRVADPRDAEDILQDVFAELVEANQLLMPIEHVSGWLFRVARNRIIDLFRRKKGISLELDDLLPSRDAGPDAELARAVLLDELEAAIADLPQEQRDVFVAHELEGKTFKEMAASRNVSINTLLSRKRYAVLHLRQALGMLALCRILFGGVGGRGGGRRHRDWTPEEKERFRARVREKWGWTRPATDAQTTEP